MIPLGLTTAFKAEIITDMHVTELAGMFHWFNVQLKCNSFFVVSLFASQVAKVPWHLYNRWLSYLHFFSSINFKVSYIYRK